MEEIEYNQEMENESENYSRPECPYCNDNSGECEHVLLDYDATFMDFLSGYLCNDGSEIEALKEEILDLINAGVQPKISDYELKNIWDYAVDNYSEEYDELNFDVTAYFNYLEYIIHQFGGEAERYECEDGAPGYSSAYVIFYANDPEKTIKEINAHIIKEILSNKMKVKDFKKVVRLMKSFQLIKTWTAKKHHILNKVIAIMESVDHEHFSSDARIHGEFVGSYYLESKKHLRQGALKKFRGNKIMVLCCKNGSWNVRQYIVATIED
jgi:hypothetical protein